MDGPIAEVCATSKTDRHLSRQKIRQRFSVILEFLLTSRQNVKENANSLENLEE